MMKRGKTRKDNSNQTQTQEKSDIQGEIREDSNDDHMSMDNLLANIDTIHKEILANRSDVKEQLSCFRENLTSDMKRDLASFKEDVNKKLNEIKADIKETRDRTEEALQRVSEVEEWTGVAKEVLSESLTKQDQIQAKLLDLEARSRRNNIRLYGIPEDAEGNNLQEFIETFIKAELELQDTDLNIQRCHRALGPKPPQDVSPRSVVIYFLEYRIKELVLRNAWKKGEIRLDQRRVYFDQDYPAETQKKRKAYAPIRKLLKEKGLRFQTPPPAKLRVFFEGGTVTYNSPAEAVQDLRMRGLMPEDDNMGTADTSPTERLKKSSWETVKTKRYNPDAHSERARKKLSGFQRDAGATAPLTR